MKRTTRPNWTKFVGWNNGGHVLDKDKALASWNEGDFSIVAGVIRWDSNNSVPPTAILEDWAEIGCDFDLEASLKAREADTDAFLTEYRANPPKLTEEDMFEMRAAFGPGETVVDVITGRQIKL